MNIIYAFGIYCWLVSINPQQKTPDTCYDLELIKSDLYRSCLSSETRYQWEQTYNILDCNHQLYGRYKDKNDRSQEELQKMKNHRDYCPGINKFISEKTSDGKELSHQEQILALKIKQQADKLKCDRHCSWIDPKNVK